jgi:hypothetical protein
MHLLGIKDKLSMAYHLQQMDYQKDQIKQLFK